MLPPKRFFVQQVDSFRGSHNAILNVSSKDEAPLVLRYDQRSYRAQPISQDLSDNLELEVSQGNWSEIVKFVSLRNFRDQNEEIRI